MAESSYQTFLRKELTVLKQSEEYAWLYDVSNNIAKQAIKDACEAYKRFSRDWLINHDSKQKESKTLFYNDNVKLKVKENKF